MPFELNLKNYLWIQGAILVLGLVFMLWKPKRQGMRLKFSKSTSSPDDPKTSNLVQFEGKRETSRSLQVFFNYNGHTFEAYEALGVPAGASLNVVEEAFREQKLLANAESRPFLEAAFQALNASLKSSKN